MSRRGNEVLRTAGPWTPNVHRLLRLCVDSDIDGVPRPLGYTADGRERLSFLPGTVPAYPMPDWVWSAEVLDDAARLLRRLHDASVPLAGVRAGWRSPVRQPAEVVCHNDFAPYNLVFLDGRLTGVIDFDYCSPGARLWDLSYLAYRIAPLEAGPFTAGQRAARLHRVLTTYGSDASVDELLATVVRRLDDLADFSDDAAARLGNPELADHATGYRKDAARIAEGRLAP
ncbi:MAG TPA: phosphotransferase [Propionicimonas sp.]|uniref:phosphotransferase n=1 Tax=Propionicimonas sp. TaxID=1955623 RepID=UPI002F418BCC